MSPITHDTTVGAIVSENYKTAGIFRKYEIDFCCNGGKTISDACKGKQVAPEYLEHEVQLILDTQGKAGANFNTWPLDLLARFIEKEHHRYIRETIPLLLDYLDKIVPVHGYLHPELYTIRQLFRKSSDLLLRHMAKEELLIFPYIKQMTEAHDRHTPFITPPFESIRNPLKKTMGEHAKERAWFKKIAALCNNYVAPDDACPTYRLALTGLKEFEEGLQGHIHLESNILFLKSIQLENELSAHF
jgi:regulator of cell morphogenesis and NO signaling